jgi:hypothetical protein
MTAIDTYEPIGNAAVQAGTIEARDFSFWYGK